MKKNEQSFKDLWDTKYPNIHIIGVSEREEVDERKNVWRNNVWKYYRLEEDTVIHTSRSSNKINPKNSTLKYITIKWSKTKDKERILEVGTEIWCIISHIQVILNNIHNGLSSETTDHQKDRSQWDDIFRMLTEKDYQTRILCLAELSFKSEGHIKIFLNKQKLREFFGIRPSLEPQ